MNYKWNKIETFQLDENGKYIFLDSIFVYDPSKNYDDQKRYTVIFNYDYNGNYKREISDDGKVYYTYMQEEYRVKGNDYYSPYDIFRIPKKKQFGYVDTKYSINKYFNVGWQFRGSNFNSSLLNNENDKIGKAYNVLLRIDSIKIFDNKFELEYAENNRSDNYKPLSREFVVQRSRLWNFDSTISKHKRKSFQSFNFKL